MLDSPETDFPLFAPPSEPISDNKYAIGLHAAGLVRDGGTLQIGIGQVGDALAQGLVVRHRDNAQFHGIMQQQLARIQMMPVSFTNEIFGDEDGKRRARVDARFVNNAMMATLLGAAISDGLENGQVVSGVGGQYNFVAQAFALEGARSVLALEATRQSGKQAQSNIRWSYGHETIPRHLRDVFVTEYGVADVRGKSDADVIAAMLQVSDSRFQGELMRQAKDAGKLPRSYEIPAAHRENYPERIGAALRPARDAGLLPSFPFGSDFIDVEQRLIPALRRPAVARHAASARCRRPRMPGAARSRQADAFRRARLSRARHRGLATEPEGLKRDEIITL